MEGGDPFCRAGAEARRDERLVRDGWERANRIGIVRAGVVLIKRCPCGAAVRHRLRQTPIDVHPV
jgi:hypothetical protein